MVISNPSGKSATGSRRNRPGLPIARRPCSQNRVSQLHSALDGDAERYPPVVFELLRLVTDDLARLLSAAVYCTIPYLVEALRESARAKSICDRYLVYVAYCELLRIAKDTFSEAGLDHQELEQVYIAAEERGGGEAVLVQRSSPDGSTYPPPTASSSRYTRRIHNLFKAMLFTICESLICKLFVRCSF